MDDVITLSSSDSSTTSKRKIIRVNGVAFFLLHVAQCIILNQTKFITATLVSEAKFNSLYSRLGFKVIKDFATYPNFEEDRNIFHYESGK